MDVHIIGQRRSNWDLLDCWIGQSASPVIVIQDLCVYDPVHTLYNPEPIPIKISRRPVIERALSSKEVAAARVFRLPLPPPAKAGQALA